jgi:hypothetical protein
MRIRLLVTTTSGSLLLVATAAMGQAPGVFVTPIANAPFMAVVTEQRTSPQPGGTWIQLKSIHAIARNSAGVIYNESRPLVAASVSGDPPVVTSHVYDPQTRMNTFIYPQQKVYTQRRLARPPRTDPPDLYATPEASTLPESQFTQEKDLGTKTMEGLSVHGMLVTQNLPSPDQGGQDITVTDEYWYSADLRLNMLVKHDDPRSGSETITVTQVSRIAPDEGIFQIPSGYKPFDTAAPSSR